jgi:hypothetical protein
MHSYTVVAMAAIITRLYVLCDLDTFGKEKIFIIETNCAHNEVQAKAEEIVEH